VNPDDGVSAGIGVLMTHLIDYAGLFPPAKLPMPEAVANHARYLDDPDAWMLARMIVPCSRLDEFEREAASGLATRSTELEPCLLSVLTAPAGDPALKDDLARIAAFNRTYGGDDGPMIIDAIELRADDASAIDGVLAMLADAIFPFFELDPARDLRGALTVLAGSDAGAKIRTGGVEPAHHPSPAQVAKFIAQCAAAEVPFKATAGLHHPLRHHAAAIGCDQFGFLNVFVGAVLAFHADLDEAALTELLDERDPGAFRFTEEAIAWRDAEIDIDAAEDARLAFAVSFGSCSFDEPRADLRSLGLLP